MAIRTADPTEAPPAEWDLSYDRCECGGMGQKFHHETRTFFHVPCQGAIGGQVVSWECRGRHWRREIDQGRDPIGKGGRPFRVSAAEGWTQLGTLRENTEAWKADGNKDVQLTSRS